MSNKMPVPSMAYTGKWYMGNLQEDNWGREYITIGPYEMEDHSEDTICHVTGENSGDPEDQAKLIVAAVNHYLGLDK